MTAPALEQHRHEGCRSTADQILQYYTSTLHQSTHVTHDMQFQHRCRTNEIPRRARTYSVRPFHHAEAEYETKAKQALSQEGRTFFSRASAEKRRHYNSIHKTGSFILGRVLRRRQTQRILDVLFWTCKKTRLASQTDGNKNEHPNHPHDPKSKPISGRGKNTYNRNPSEQCCSSCRAHACIAKKKKRDPRETSGSSCCLGSGDLSRVIQIFENLETHHKTTHDTHPLTRPLPLKQE